MNFYIHLEGFITVLELVLVNVVLTGCELLNKQPITKWTVVCSTQMTAGEMESFRMLTTMKHTLQSHAHKPADVISSSKNSF
jgi:hypothetical protein